MGNKYTIKDVLDHRSVKIKNLCFRFIKEVPDDPIYLDRLSEELDIIESKGFVRCFEQVSEIVSYTRSRGIPHVLRGSGACSLMCYLLGITSIDPVKEGMVFTIEPGIYIREENLGIRLENNFVVGANGNVDLMKSIPIEAEEIEDLMNA